MASKKLWAKAILALLTLVEALSFYQASFCAWMAAYSPANASEWGHRFYIRVTTGLVVGILWIAAAIWLIRQRRRGTRRSGDRNDGSLDATFAASKERQQMNPESLANLLRDIGSGDLARQVAALDQYLALPAGDVVESERLRVAAAAAVAMNKCNNPVLITQRLAHFGPEVVAPLLHVLNGDSNPEVRTLAAFLLMEKGCNAGASRLQNAVETDGPYAFLAAKTLFRAGFTDHVPAMIERLRRCQMPPGVNFPEDNYGNKIAGQLDLLRHFGVALPDDVNSKFFGAGAPPFFRRMVK